jgi:hypothetical protein
MEYTIVGDGKMDRLISKVNELIRQGWKPIGGIALDTRAAGIGGFYQAMAREKP